MRAGDGSVGVDVAMTRPGRGAYVCAEPACVERALKSGRLVHAFRASCRVGEGVEETVLAAGQAPAAAGHDSGS